MNLTGLFHITQSVIRRMLAHRTGGHIVNITTSLVDHPASKKLTTALQIMRTLPGW